MQQKKAAQVNAGFTLIEIIITVGIIALLASIVLFAINSARDKGDDAKRNADIQQLQLALKAYRNVRENYPTTTASAPGSLAALEDMVPDYVGKLPDDPKGDGTYPGWSSGTENAYYYWNLSNGTPSGCSSGDFPQNAQYVLWYHLKNKSESGNAPNCLVRSGVNSFVVSE